MNSGSNLFMSKKSVSNKVTSKTSLFMAPRMFTTHLSTPPPISMEEGITIANFIFLTSTFDEMCKYLKKVTELSLE